MASEDLKHMVCWLPWLPIPKKIELGPIQFYPFGASNTDPFDKLAKDLHRVMSGFHDIHGKPIKELTIVVADGKVDLPLLDDKSIQQVRNAVQLLMLGSMSSIRYFSHTQYTNSSSFELVVEKFVLGNEYVSVVGRRRDGRSVDGGYEYGEIARQAPQSVHLSRVLQSDDEFLKVLSGAVTPTKSEHNKLLLSLNAYRLANTDDNQVDLAYELVQLEWSIEHLIDPGEGSRKFQDRIACLLKEYVTVMANQCKRPDNGADVNKMPRSEWLLVRQWAWEFYEIRSEITHGDPNWERKAWRWDIFEHCVFAAWLYPLLAKLIFARCGDYILTGRDKASLKAIDRLLSDNNWKNNWNQVLAQSLIQVGLDNDVEHYCAEHGAEIQKRLDLL